MRDYFLNCVRKAIRKFCRFDNIEIKISLLLKNRIISFIISGYFKSYGKKKLGMDFHPFQESLRSLISGKISFGDYFFKTPTLSFRNLFLVQPERHLESYPAYNELLFQERVIITLLKISEFREMTISCQHEIISGKEFKNCPLLHRIYG